jgi:hypothetical protein
VPTLQYLGSLGNASVESVGLVRVGLVWSCEVYLGPLGDAFFQGVITEVVELLLCLQGLGGLCCRVYGV